MRISRGEDSGSTAKNWLEKSQPISVFHLNQNRLIVAMRRLWIEVVVHNHFLWESQVVGSSMIVGIRIFNIGVG